MTRKRTDPVALISPTKNPVTGIRRVFVDGRHVADALPGPAGCCRVYLTTGEPVGVARSGRPLARSIDSAIAIRDMAGSTRDALRLHDAGESVTAAAGAAGLVYAAGKAGAEVDR